MEYEPVTLNLGLFDPQQQGAVISAPLDLNDGFVIGGAVGRTFGRRFRGEFEFAYRNARLQSAGISINGQPQGELGIDGTLNQYSAMPNLLVDLNPGGRINVYGGVGAGVVFNDLDAREETTPVGIRLRASSFAYQGIVGVSTRLRCRLEPFAEYRYFGTDKLRIDAVAPIGSANADVDITSNNVVFGVRLFR